MISQRVRRQPTRNQSSGRKVQSMNKARRLVLGAAVAALVPLVSACSSTNKTTSPTTVSAAANGGAKSTSAPTSVTDVATACAPNYQTIPIAYAMQSGLDVKNGIKLHCVQVTTGPQEAAAMISGGINIAGFNPVNLYPLLDRGAQIVAFQPIDDRPFFDIIVRKGFPLPDQSAGWKGVMKDLAHARIGVPARGGAGEFIADGLFNYAGVPDTGVTYISTGIDTTTIAAMSKGQIDAAMTYEPGISLAVANGIAVAPFSLQALTGPPQMNWGSLFATATRSYATAHRQVLKDYQKTYLEGLSWVKNPSNRGPAIAFIQKDMGVPQSIATTIYLKDIPSLTSSTTVEASRYNYEGQFFHQIGLTKKAWTVADYGFNVNG